MTKPRLPVLCPSCQHALSVSQMRCLQCATTVSGDYSLPALLKMGIEEQQFIVDFFLLSGSLKEMAVKMGVSYPTVRNRLDDLIEKIKKTQDT